MNVGLQCTIDSERAQKARFARHFDSSVLRKSLIALVLLSVVTCGALIVIGSVFGYLLLGVASVVAMIVLWYYGELNHLVAIQPLHDAAEISAVLDRKLLAKVPKDASPKQLAEIVFKQEGGFFFASRFGLGNDYLNLSANDVGSSALVWSHALQLAQIAGTKVIDSAALTGGLILSVPAASQHLGTMALDEKDITDAVVWYAHITAMIERARTKNTMGGIGRDLSFGWAPILNKVGFNITESIERGGYLRRSVPTRDQDIDQTLRLLAQQGRRNAVLVGEPGVGKTTLVYSLAQKLLTRPKDVPAGMAYQQVITLDAANLIANAKQRGQLEQLLIRVFNEAAQAKNVIIFLDEAQLFLEERTGSVDLSSILLPVLQGGAIKIVLSMSDQEWLRLSQSNPGLTGLMNRVVIKPLERDETIRVIEDEVILLETRNSLVYMYQSLNEAYKLADRFVHEQAFPGKAIKLLEAAANFPDQTHFITAGSVRKAVEKSFDVKVQAADTVQERDTLLNLETEIHKRMINQTRAVTLVSDALRRARSGVRNENKPIGTFLFLGPTGVGKTELTKALAAVYFGGEDRMVRVDLNEFSHAEDTNRLLAAGANDPYSLCAQIAKQPFSVVLLDEIEKAHPNVLNLLLQMLDEGVLRDSSNKPVSFRDAIIISTSNAGAEQIRKHIEAGQALEQFEDEFIDELINANVFRPEFLNRFDEIILFRPLSKQELMLVVDLLLARLNKTLADRKVTVTLTDRAKELLVDRGYDPRLGARPLRRVMQRAVENLVAKKLLEGSVGQGGTVQLDAPELHAILQDR
jgi:ATP-dependent Clp protease ATP-binding subunit ClpC